jgi:aldehyde:ferredoxin oxidoreductase
MYGGPEYESVASFGANLGNESLESIAVANALCNANGLDIISAGGMIAFVTECFEKGLIDSSKTDGQALKFGDPNAMLVLLQKIISRTGVGDVLAAGVERVREYFGPECERYLMAVKGQFMAYHEPRTKFSLGLGNAVAPGGADHLQTVHDQKYATAGNATAEQVKAFGVLEPLPAKYLGPEKVRAFYYLQQWESLVSILGACFFACTAPSVLTQDDIVSLARAATGWNISLWELMKAGERGLMMAHLFNLRNGVGPSDDTLPERFFEAVADGPSKGARLDRKDFESARRLYYEMMGWDPVSGVPLKGRLAELGLEWAGEEEREHSTMP